MRVLAVVLTLLLVCLASTSAFAAQRVVLCEDFTNDLCPPCDAIQDTMDALFASESSPKLVENVRGSIGELCRLLA